MRKSKKHNRKQNNKTIINKCVVTYEVKRLRAIIKNLRKRTAKKK